MLTTTQDPTRRNPEKPKLSYEEKSQTGCEAWTTPALADAAFQELKTQKHLAIHVMKRCAESALSGLVSITP